MTFEEWSQITTVQDMRNTPGVHSCYAVSKLAWHARDAEVERLRRLLLNTTGRLRTASGWPISGLQDEMPPLYDETAARVLARWWRELDEALGTETGDSIGNQP